eukprot:TRINITY_DN5479_c0_g3_i1.p1 TRINITY_DN5479_c0_g3~~TRINITY_DN5479_c0_g3_i1.p1  ORF type:complete len:778 (-),score=147.20 TRINITY_DN5479_c0_g3_i1:6-2309(-)
MALKHLREDELREIFSSPEFAKFVERRLKPHFDPQHIQEQPSDINIMDSSTFREALLDPAGTGMWKRLKLLVVGDAAAGKTSTLRWLQQKPFVDSHNSTNSLELMTVDMRDWKEVKPDMAIAAMLSQRREDAAPKVSTKPSFLYEPVWAADDGAITDYDANIAQEIQTFEVTSYIQNTRSSELNHDEELLKSFLDRITPKLSEIKDQALTFQAWDFGGQEVYYNTHHFFLSETAIYLLIMDISLSEDILRDRLRFWLQSIRFYAKGAPIVIIGTHQDKLHSAEENTEKIRFLLNETLEIIHEFCPSRVFSISCQRDEMREYTQTLLLKIAEGLPIMNKPCPLRWMWFFDCLEKHQDEILSIISLEKALSIGKSCGMKSEHIEAALQFFHELGFVLYFCNDAQLDQLVFLRPQQLVNALRRVVTMITTDAVGDFQFGPYASDIQLRKVPKDRIAEVQNKGYLSRSTLRSILWADYPPNVQETLEVLLQKFELAVSSPQEPGLIVPCLVTKEPDPSLMEGSSCFWWTYEVGGPISPMGFATRIVVRALEIADKRRVCKLFRGGCVIVKNKVLTRIDIRSGQVKIQVRVSKAEECLAVVLELLQEVASLSTSSERSTVRTQCLKCSLEILTASWKSEDDFMCDDCILEMALSSTSPSTASSSSTSSSTNSVSASNSVGPTLSDLDLDHPKRVELVAKRLEISSDWKSLRAKLLKDPVHPIARDTAAAMTSSFDLIHWMINTKTPLRTLVLYLREIERIDIASYVEEWMKE